MTIRTQPQASWSLRTDKANLCDATQLLHHQPIRESCRSWSRILWLPSLTWLLKVPSRNALCSLGRLGHEPPVSLHGPAIKLLTSKLQHFSFCALGIWTCRQHHDGGQNFSTWCTKYDLHLRHWLLLSPLLPYYSALQLQSISLSFMYFLGFVLWHMSFFLGCFPPVFFHSLLTHPSRSTLIPFFF